MKKIILLNKKEGETPLQALEKFRLKNSKYKNIKMTYAGRLDPMARGVLLILAGDEIKNKEKYLALDKEYEFEVLFGCATDTFDILGKITQQDSTTQDLVKKKLIKEIKYYIKSFLGEQIQKYPPYSSKTVLGKSLFMYARAGEEIEIPTRKICIRNLKLKNIRKLDNKKLLQNIEKRIQKVEGDFRQKEISENWQKYLSSEKKLFMIAFFKIKCSSGTYVRVIAHSLGTKMNIPALAFSIKRNKIGKYVL